MSITRTESFPCACGALVSVLLVESLNADRHPLLRQSVIDRELHAVKCAACQRVTVVEHRFLYVDLERRQLIGVFPRGERDNADEHARLVQDTFEQWFVANAPAWIRERARDFLVRACFGLEELREKLVADDAKLDDCKLEGLKCVLLATDPVYRASAVATLRLERVDADSLYLVPVNVDEQVLNDIVRVPRADFEAIAVAEIRRAFPQIAVDPHVSMLRMMRA